MQPDTTKPSPYSYIGAGYKKDFRIYKASGSSTSLDIYLQNSPSFSEWSTAQKRCYQRLKSGLKRHQGERLRFITLTTPINPKRGLSEAFGVLKHRIKRVRVKRLVDEGYLKRGDVRRFYSGGVYKVGLAFDYLKTRGGIVTDLREPKKQNKRVSVVPVPVPTARGLSGVIL